jgi:hypothetical protein
LDEKEGGTVGEIVLDFFIEMLGEILPSEDLAFGDRLFEEASADWLT